ncbi:hypothetical protein C4D60_Mb04t38900 [Musa balbisiana]|uniref:Uncharacterized protein n=1 Tax=Musa balbisiana TaxID=52838 RepID=A0A4S8KHU8_MUSBA|nr:hypothetical protein C4D60_Mb04t38900 [Musa balbisiana]
MELAHERCVGGPQELSLSGSLSPLPLPLVHAPVGPKALCPSVGRVLILRVHNQAKNPCICYDTISCNLVGGSVERKAPKELDSQVLKKDIPKDKKL